MVIKEFSYTRPGIGPYCIRKIFLNGNGLFAASLGVFFLRLSYHEWLDLRLTLFWTINIYNKLTYVYIYYCPKIF